jgi:hypothetical protein
MISIPHLQALFTVEASEPAAEKWAARRARAGASARIYLAQMGFQAWSVSGGKIV